MTTSPSTTTVALRSVDSPAVVFVDPETALPVAVFVEDGGRGLERRLRVNVNAVIGGHEDRGWTGGLQYLDTEFVPLRPDPRRSARTVHRGQSDDRSLPVTLGPLEGRIVYRLFPTSPFLEMALELSSPGPAVVVRDVHVDVDVLGPADELVLNAPGNVLRRDVRVTDLGSAAVGISPLGGLRGSSAVVTIEQHGAVTTIWPTQRAEIPDLAVVRIEDGLRLQIRTRFAAVLEAGGAELTLVTFNLQDGDLEQVRRQWPRWAQRYGLGTPADKPSWVDAARIYEVQVGTSHFWGGHEYTPYSSVAEVADDLERIQALGFSVLQMMPKHPYPSYNVHDYADVTTSYGDEDDLRRLVKEAHRRGMRVILDVLLHGVVDHESVDAALDGIRRGPLHDRLHEPPKDSFASDLSDMTDYLIAWSRHIVDFADHWKAGSPTRTPLEDEHPEWFSRDSAGSVTGTYTKAFDARNRGWQRHFRNAMLHLMRELDIDGFRFDAPTYNDFPNWAPWARSRASLSPLGCVPLFADLRDDLRDLKADALMYTEPSGHLLRTSMDLSYNYDEQWLVSAMADSTTRTAHGVQNARELMLWFQDRDAFLPPGSKTAHHIDSHDTFWWPEWGTKWRREQFGLEMTRAPTCTFLALDGPYMLFTGGEQGVERELQLLCSLRRDRPELWASAAVFDTESDPTGSLFLASRGDGPSRLLLAVNLTGREAVALPQVYRSDCRIVGSEGLVAGSLRPRGYLVGLTDG